MLNVKKLLTKILTALEPAGDTPVTGIAVYKIGSIVCVRINIASTAYSTGWNTLGTLPAKYRPASRVDFWAVDNNTTTGTAAHCLLSIDSSTGSVRFYKYASNSSSNIQLMGNITYTLGGGYCVALFSMLSAIERWWEHAKYQEAFYQDTRHALCIRDTNADSMWEELGVQENRQGGLLRRSRRHLFSFIRLEQYRHIEHKYAPCKYTAYKARQFGLNNVCGHSIQWHCSYLLSKRNNERKQRSLLDLFHSQLTSERGWAVC